jgi:hypothetical protein
LTDPLKPWEPPTDSIVSLGASIVFISAGKTSELIRALKGADVAVGSTRGLMAKQDFDPSKKDTVIRDNDTLRIKSIDTLAPNGEVILHTIEFDE